MGYLIDLSKKWKHILNYFPLGHFWTQEDLINFLKKSTGISHVMVFTPGYKLFFYLLLRLHYWVCAFPVPILHLTLCTLSSSSPCICVTCSTVSWCFGVSCSSSLCEWCIRRQANGPSAARRVSPVSLRVYIALLQWEGFSSHNMPKLLREKIQVANCFFSLWATSSIELLLENFTAEKFSILFLLKENKMKAGDVRVPDVYCFIENTQFHFTCKSPLNPQRLGKVCLYTANTSCCSAVILCKTKTEIVFLTQIKACLRQKSGLVFSWWRICL